MSNFKNLAWINLVFLTVQFLVGWYVDFSNDFPSIFSTNIFLYGGLAFHIVLGLVVGAIGIALLIISLKRKTNVRTALISLVFLGISGVTGLLFMISNFLNNTYSNLMMLFSVLALMSYFYLAIEIEG
ncbi:hypothetical protein [Sulfuracidifex metallicus]|uniref:Uncharacterized protein n=1 Tax=Sulfuracidifex metallicus DSM 6482 = JCM 9184 TaxID=523847 RepID=A0A6A9QWF3_SULME|nr:hypothetical protein [Sulfuracidifex metallicus]MUN30033.1 hypothetical protein [Sulfuracidifex metallicus DSM 6482 = JCM 9184]WOE51587.1 hypothetical protein RQ359_000903 [Sulfuracidifex metallicus DSM 6482 = JCM 9184]